MGKAFPSLHPALPWLLLLVGCLPLRGGESVTLEPVEITARREAEARWRLPVATTAYGGDWLAANAIADYQELARIVPGLFVMQQTPDNVSLNLRGLTSDTGDPRMQPRISVFQDGVALNNAHGNSVALFDLADAAVFKGPQATAFGRGVEGGAIALASRRAANENSGAVTLGAGDYAAANAEVMVNRVVVADRLFARVAVHASRRDGYVTNLAGGDDLQGERTLAVRASLRWQPSAATTADVIFHWQRDLPSGLAAKAMAAVPGLPAIDTDPFTAVQLNRGAELGVSRTIAGLTGILQRRLGAAWTLTATSAWRDVESNNEFDIDGSAYYLLEAAEQFGGRQLSQELRLEYDGGGQLTGAAGVAIFDAEDAQTAVIRSDENVLWRFLTGTPPPVAFNPRYAEQNTNEARTTAGDVFGRADYQLTDRFALGGGVRLTRERIGARYRSLPAAIPGRLVGAVPSSGGGNNFFQNTAGWVGQTVRETSWMGQLEARYAATPRLTAYATVARGRHAPMLGFDEVTLAPQRYLDETVWNYEAGVRGASASRRFRYEAALFHYRFEHFVTQRVTTFGALEPFDGGRARGRGAEAVVQADVTRALTAFATYGFTDAEFADTDDTGAPQLFAGHAFRLTSRHVVSLGGTATLPLAGRGAFFLTPLFTYRSRYFFEDNNAQNGGILQQGGHGLLNLRLGYRPARGRWEIAAYATNLLDKKYLLDAGNIGGAYGLPTSIPAAPRMMGVKATREF